MIPDQTILVRIINNNKKRYIQLGYPKAKIGEYIDVNIKDLPQGSHHQVKVICDYCGKEYSGIYRDVLKCRNQSSIHKDVCKKCKYIKQQEVFKLKYGVENAAMIESGKIKCKQTNLQRYGVDNPLKNQNIREKVKQTCLKRYGVESPMQCDAIKSKSSKMLYLSGNIPTSSQQLQIFNIISNFGYNAVLNYPVSFLNLDVAVFINNKKIDIEYDGWYWHQNVSKDIARNHVLYKYGWNVIRILSNRLLPTEEQLQQAINNVLSKNKQIQLIQLDDWKNNDKKREVI